MADKAQTTIITTTMEEPAEKDITCDPVDTRLASLIPVVPIIEYLNYDLEDEIEKQAVATITPLISLHSSMAPRFPVLIETI
ncbi:hypothetical protein IMZ48_36695 [Candidatus Bathyarchaeota archaeon]|nr:hypothetical protein [Candidatus Bathyarchaeota archaeon]